MNDVAVFEYVFDQMRVISELVDDVFPAVRSEKCISSGGERVLRWTSADDQVSFLSHGQRAISIGQTECCSTIDGCCDQSLRQAHVAQNTG